MSTFKHIYNEKLKVIAEQENIDPKTLKKYVETIDSHFKKMKEHAKKGVNAHKGKRPYGWDRDFERVLESIERHEKLMKLVKAKSARTRMFHTLIRLNNDLKSERKKVESDKSLSPREKEGYTIFMDPIIKELGQLLNKIHFSNF